MYGFSIASKILSSSPVKAEKPRARPVLAECHAANDRSKIPRFLEFPIAILSKAGQ